MSFLELRIPPLLVVALFAAAMAGIAWLVPAADIPFAGRHWIAGGVAIVGIGIALGGVRTFSKHETTINPFTPNQTSTLVASGIYSRTRNPMYLGDLLMLVAWELYLGNLASALLLPGFVAYMNRFQIAPEERVLARKFGREFASYRANVRRWL